MLKPDYNKSILNLSNSILRYYGVKTEFPGLEKIDKLLAKNYKNVVVLLFDALGEYNLNMNPDINEILINHKIDVIDSVFPPTTTAATTTFTSGLPPAIHNWLGWSLYFKEEDSNVNIFKNTNDDNISAFDKDVANTYIPYESIFDKLNKTNKVKADTVAFFGTVKADTLDEITTNIKALCNDEERRFIYAYHNEPDTTMHKKGVNSEETKSVIKFINQSVKELIEELNDTLLIITADHGHIDGESLKLSAYPDVKDTLLRNPSIEPRANSLFIKEGKKGDFLELFDKYFKDDFILLSHEEVIKEKIFGEDSGNTKYQDFIGDYLMISVKNKSLFFDDNKANIFKGVHAGMTEAEMKIPLIVFECK